MEKRLSESSQTSGFCESQTRILKFGPVIRGMTWGVMLWLVSQALIVPATGGGMFSSATGGLRVVLESLVGHLVYGLVFGVWLGVPGEEPSEQRHTFGSEPHARRAG